MIEHICRVCLSFHNKEKLVSLVDDNTINGGLNCYGQAVMAFANVVIQKDDSYPKSMCCHCLCLLRKAIYFKIICESSQNTLETYAENMQKPTCSDKEMQQFLFEALLFKTYFPIATDVRGEPQGLDDSKTNMVEIEIFCDQNKSKSNTMKDKNEMNVKREKINSTSDSIDMETNPSLEDGNEDGNIILDEFEEILQADAEAFGKHSYLGYKITEVKKKSKFFGKRKLQKSVESTNNSCNLKYDNVANPERHLPKKEEQRNENTNITYLQAEPSVKKKNEDKTNKKIHKLKKDNQGSELSGTRVPYFQAEPRKKKKRKGPTKINKKCPFCPKVLATVFTYRRHMIIHEGGGGWVCELCGKNYPDQNGFQYHQAIKHGVGQYFKCKECDYKAPYKNYLVEHERLHTGERPFSCDKCGLSFRRQAIWKKHLVHHEEKTVKCDQCSKMFHSKYDVIAHCNSVHERKHMYACPKCGALYSDNSTVRKHLTKRHGIPREDQGKIERVNVSKASCPPFEQE